MAMRRGDPRVMRLVVRVLRSIADLTQEDFGRASWVSQAEVSRFEAGLDVPSEETLRQMARTADVEWPVVVHLIRFFTAVRSAVDRPAPAGRQTGAEPLDDAVLDAVLLAVAPYLVEEIQARRGPTLKEERREAEEVWAALEGFPDSRRRELIELGPPQARTSALVEVVSEASEREAALLSSAARELADFACFIAERRLLDLEASL